jgi:hypothetical protein
MAVLDHLGGIDIDHSRHHPLHDRRIGKPQFGLGGWDVAVLSMTRHQHCQSEE